ncbi:MAG: LacI family DNA-binding transcriptional regulator [Bacilli bacterium]
MGNDKKTRATIYQVAKEANVSLATVSRVLNGKGNVSPETERLVNDVIARLGYIPSGIARGLATQLTANVGIVLPSPNYVYINNIMAGMLDVCKIYGYSPSVFTYEGISDVASAIDRVIASRVEGIVVFNSQLNAEDVSKLTNFSLPIVIIGEDSLHQHNANVNIDYSTSLARYITERVNQGIRTIRFLRDPNKDWHMINRFQNAIESVVSTAAGVDFQSIDISDSYTVIYDYYKTQFQHTPPANELYILPRDSLAIAINNAALDLGYRIPEQLETVAIVGTKHARMARPQVSTFEVDWYEVGSITMRMLTKMLQGTLSNKSYNFATTYVRRKSSKR